VAPLVIFMADTGARPAEAVAVEWRHVDLEARTVELPGSKTNLAWRTVHLTRRGLRRSARCRARSRAATSFRSTGARCLGRTSTATCGSGTRSCWP
jgi:integrase